ncbi:hypothetical protein CNR22_15060 [Sphingobacteriaceae bacterium]|nr:hypothetical protein CNR22_15060 [Sphingobacteriaceae bacterium]
MRLIYLFLVVLLSGGLFSQTAKLNPALKMRLSEKSSPEKVYSILVQGDITKLKAAQREAGFTFNYSSGDVASITCNATAISFLIDHNIISYAEFKEAHAKPMNDTMVFRNRIKAAKLGTHPLTQGYDGTDIVLGFIDTGIDVVHKDFKDAQGNTRIKFLWDQTTNSGSTVPSPYGYGIEWTDTQINANQCTHSDMAYYGHGTHVSGIAAGNGLSNGTHEGVAPKADIVMVAVNFNMNGPTTADAVDYILSKASLLGKPCVINASLGDYYGSHDGTDLEAKLIESMIANIPGRVMVAAAGNAGYVKFHVKTQNTSPDTSFTWLRNGQSTEHYWFYGDTSQVKNLQISVGGNRTDFSNVGRIAFHTYTYGLGPVKHDTLKYNGNRIAIIDNSSSINNSGVYELYLRIRADSTDMFWRVETKGTGVHHAWNFDFVSTGLPTLAQYPPMAHYKMADTMYSMVSSYQCSDEIITVANYFNLNSWYDVRDSLNHIVDPAGSLAGTSSSGPTRDGRQKPDISATGQAVFSTLVTGMQATQIAQSPETVAQGSFHVIGGGTSAASPVVAGLAALYLQAHPMATNQQVKQAITHCAYSDQYTGTLPNYAWGHGKLDGFAAMFCEENLVGLQKNKLHEQVNYYPNPFNTKVTIELPTTTVGKISFYNAEGKLLLEDKIDGKVYELHSAHLKTAQSGLYFVRIVGQSSSYAFKLIKD